jgi:hypothetical protein
MTRIRAGDQSISRVMMTMVVASANEKLVTTEIRSHFEQTIDT